MYKSTGHRKKITGLAALLCVLLCCMTAIAAFHGGSGNGGSYRFIEHSETTESLQSTETAETAETADSAEQGTITTVSSPGKKTVCSTPATTADTGTGALTWTENGQTFYQFEGKKYVVKEDWGVHYLTGFSPESTGSIRTASGVNATSSYTAASTRANLNKVILVKAEGGTGSSAGRNRYDGVYKCQDTGGQAVETGLSTTGNVPVVDLFFDTAGEADQVSANGWIFARIYILEEVK